MSVYGTPIKNPYKKLFSSNQSDSSFDSKTPTTTKPSGGGIVTGLGSKAGLIFFGTDAANETFDVRVWGWSSVEDSLWVPFLLADVTCTLGSTQGVAGEAITDSDFIVDTITGNSGDAGREIISPTGDLVASLHVENRGANRLEVEFDMTGAADANALYWMY